MNDDEHDCRRDGCAVGEPCDRDGGARVPAGYRRDPDDEPEKAPILGQARDQRVYVRRKVVHVCFNGKTYGAPLGCTCVTPERHVTVWQSSVLDALGEVVLVSQRLPMGSIVEVWTGFSF